MTLPASPRPALTTTRSGGAPNASSAAASMDEITPGSGAVARGDGAAPAPVGVSEFQREGAESIAPGGR